MPTLCLGLSMLVVPQAPALAYPWSRFLILVLCGLFLFGLAAAFTRGAPLKFIVGKDNRYSNSKFQCALWFWVVISTYMATVVFRVWTPGGGWNLLGGVSIPQNLLVLSGMSALTFGGAKAITTAKVNKAIATAKANKAIATATGSTRTPDPADTKPALNPGEERFFRDLVQNDKDAFDFGDFQMLVVTLLAVVMYLMLVYHLLGSTNPAKMATLPDVDTTILAVFGLGQGAYLTKKAAGNVGES